MLKAGEEEGMGLESACLAAVRNKGAEEVFAELPRPFMISTFTVRTALHRNSHTLDALDLNARFLARIKPKIPFTYQGKSLSLTALT